ncbi:hypothetical protein Tco_0735052 [Tanacetum coccineum]
MYDSWASRIHLFIKGKKHGRMMLDSIDNGLLVYPTVEENGQTRLMKYSELTEAQQLQDDCDVQETNIILHGLPPDVYALVNHQEVDKDIWDRVKMLMKGTKLSYQERECRLYNLFDKFAHIPSETLIKVSTIKQSTQNIVYTKIQSTPFKMVEHVSISLRKTKSEFMLVTENRGIATTSKGKCFASWLTIAGSPKPGSGQIMDEEQLHFFSRPLSISELHCSADNPSEYSFQKTDDWMHSNSRIVIDLPWLKALLMQIFQACIQKFSLRDNEIHSCSNIIPYSQYLQETQDADIQDTTPFAPNDLLVLSLVEQMTDHVKEDFGKHFVTKKELSAEQAFWLKHLSLSETPITSHTPIRIESPSELPKVSLVNESVKKLKYQLANFDKVVKKRLTSNAITAGSWGFEHTKECFVTEIILFLKVLKDTFNTFDKTLLDEITKVQTVFNQMEAAVDQCSVDKNIFEIQIKQLRIDNDQLLNQIMSQEIMHIVANSVDILDVKKSCVNNCNKCLELETELFKKKDFIEKEAYDKLVKSYSNLEKHCISLELATQLNQEIFQRENSGENLNAPTFNQLFEINELKAQSQEKDMVIRKLKDSIKSLNGKDSLENVKKDIDDIEIINIELEHSVTKLLSENENLRKEREHLKSIYKD